MNFNPHRDGVFDLRIPAAPHLASLAGRGTLLLVAWLMGTAICKAQQLHLAKEIVPSAELQRVTPEGWRFTAAGRSITAPEVVRWGAWPGILRNQAVWLSDGSWLAGELQFQGGETLNVRSDWLSIPPIDLAMVRGMVINPPASLSKWVELQQQMSAAEGGRDVVWLLNKQRIAGVIRWGEAQQENQYLVLDSGSPPTTRIDLQEVQAIVLSPTLAGKIPEPPPRNLGLVDGSLLRVDRFAVKQRHVELQLPSGLAIRSLDAPAEWTAAVRYMAGAPDGIRFLSDLQPVRYRSVSETKLTWELGVDRDVLGKPLTWNGGIVAKGLALHSSSQVAYRWEGGGGRFLAQVVLAPADPQATAPLGSVTCRVLVARAGKLETAHEVKLERRASPPTVAPAEQRVDIDITGTQLIVLIVEKNDYGQYGDQVFWLDARITRR